MRVEVLQYDETYQGIRVAEDSDAIVIAVVKELLGNSDDRKGYACQARKGYAQGRSRYLTEFRRVFGERVGSQLDEFLLGVTVTSKAALARKMRRSLLLRNLWQNPLGTVSVLLRSLAKRMKRLVFKPGYSIAVLGTDGAGKSTVIHGIAEVLDIALHNKCVYNHLRPNWLPSLGQLAGRPTAEAPVENPHATGPAGVLGSLVRLTYYAVDYTLGWWVNIYPRLIKRPCVCIFDRYFYDYVFDPHRCRIGLPRPLISLFFVLAPQPDLILCLGGRAGSYSRSKTGASPGGDPTAGPAASQVLFSQ